MADSAGAQRARMMMTTTVILMVPVGAREVVLEAGVEVYGRVGDPLPDHREALLAQAMEAEQKVILGPLE